MFGDIYNIRKRIRNIDKDLNMFYKGQGTYEITHKGNHFMSVPKAELDDRTVKRVKEIVYKNVNADILAEIEANNAKVEINKQRDIDNLTESIAKEIRPLVRRLD